MKNLYILFFCLPILLQAQNSGLFLLPEAGVSLPYKAYNLPNLSSSPGYQAGLHIEKKWKTFGLGLYGGYNVASLGYEYRLPAANSGLAIERLQEIGRDQLSQLSVGLGPLLSFRLSDKIGLDLSSKFGISKINFPDFEERVRLGTFPAEEYVLYSTRYESVEQTVFPMLLSSIRLQYRLGGRASAFLSGSYSQVWNVRHSYRYLEGNFSPSLSNEALLDALRTAPTVQEIRRCQISNTSISAGISLQLGNIHQVPSPVLPAPELPSKDSLLAAIKRECAKLRVIAEKQSDDRNPCCYRIVLQNQLDPQSALFPAFVSVSVMNGNITEVSGMHSGWTQIPSNMPQKTKKVTWQSPGSKVPAGQTVLASICVEGLTPVWLDFTWHDRTGKEICRNSIPLEDCVNEEEDLCDNPMIRNGGFETNTTPVSPAPWSVGYGSPKFVFSPNSGFIDIGHVEASGNVLTGDAIVQQLAPANKINKGKKYLLTAAVRFFANENVSDYARIRAIAFNGALPVSGNKHPEVGSNLALIGRSTKIKDCGEWYIIEFFVWEAHKDFQNIALNVFTNDGTTAKVWIDNVSLCEVSYDPCAEIQLDANEQPIRPTGLPLPPPNFACKPEAEEDAYLNGSLSDLYGGAPYNYDGTTNWYANAMDKCFSIGGTIPDEVTNYNCDDSLKLAGINMTCDELQKLLEDPDVSQFDNYKPPKLPPIPDLAQGAPCESLPNDFGNMAFGGKDIIYIHGLELGHVVHRIIGQKKGALSNWPAQTQEFYQGGYYKSAADSTWINHIKYFTQNKLIPENNYKNRYLVVAYNCSQRLDVAVHSVLYQIWEAMATGRGVQYSAGDTRDSTCFGKEFVIISQSTGAMVADVLLTIANDTKTSAKMAKKYGRIGYIADRCKGHIARRGAFTGSDLATILTAIAKPTPGPAVIAAGLMIRDKTPLNIFSDPQNLSIIRSSILVDLIPPIARNKWGPYMDRVPVKVMSVSGGHPTFFSKEELDNIAQYGAAAGSALAAIAPAISLVTGVDPVTVAAMTSTTVYSLTLAALQAALSMKYIVHPGFDDGVITTDCATGRKSTFLTPSTFQAKSPLKVFDMGIPTPRAVGYFLDQRKSGSLLTSNFCAGATPYLSPSGMVQPVVSHAMNTTYKNHYTFVQAASEHWIKKDTISCDYNTTAIGGSKNYEEQLVVFDPSLFHPTTGIVDPAITSLVKEDIRGKTIPIPYVKIKRIKGIPIPVIQFKPYYIWKRTYHNLQRPYYLNNSAHGCVLDCDYVYRYLFKK